MTNFEKIKAMSVEEMADYFNCLSCYCSCCPVDKCDITLETCEKRIVEWLESEVEEDG